MDLYRSQRRRGISWAAVIVLILLTALISGGSAFLWQASALKNVYSQNDELNNEINNLMNENKNLQNQKAQLDKELQTAKSQIPKEVPKGRRETVQSLSDQILHMLKNKDFSRLAGFVHPDKGVRFSPYSHVDVNKDIVITAAEFAGIMAETQKRRWGSYDGTGDPIDLTFQEYYSKFVYDADFLEAPQIVFNMPVQRGNTILNVQEAYPGASFIEYNFPGFDPQYNGMDWKSLFLVFEEKDGKLYLSGIIHGQWTI